MITVAVIALAITVLTLGWVTWYVMRPIEVHVGSRWVTQDQVRELYRHDLQATRLIERVLGYDYKDPILPDRTREEMRDVVTNHIDKRT